MGKAADAPAGFVRPPDLIPLDLESGFFRNEESARVKIETLRWPAGIVCTHCGFNGKSRAIASDPFCKPRKGLYRCSACNHQFTVTIGTILKSSHVPLHKWLQAIHLLFAARRRVHIKTIERTLGITYKSAWNLVHRLRVAARVRKEVGRPSWGPFLPGLPKHPETQATATPGSSGEQHCAFKRASAALECGQSAEAFDDIVTSLLRPVAS